MIDRRLFALACVLIASLAAIGVGIASPDPEVDPEVEAASTTYAPMHVEPMRATSTPVAAAAPVMRAFAGYSVADVHLVADVTRACGPACATAARTVIEASHAGASRDELHALLRDVPLVAKVHVGRWLDGRSPPPIAFARGSRQAVGALGPAHGAVALSAPELTIDRDAYRSVTSSAPRAR